jgi:hypothetical protein
MADRTATDEAVDLMRWRADSDYYEARSWSAPVTDQFLASVLDALPAGLLRRLADQKTGGPLFEGRADLSAYGWITIWNEVTPYDPIPDDWPRVVVYPAPETPGGTDG